MLLEILRTPRSGSLGRRLSKRRDRVATSLEGMRDYTKYCECSEPTNLAVSETILWYS